MGDSRIEQDIRRQIEEAAEGYVNISIDGHEYPEDEWGIFGDELTAISLVPPITVEKFVSVSIYFE